MTGYWILVNTQQEQYLRYNTKQYLITSSGTMGNVEPSIAITPRSTLTWSRSNCKVPSMATIEISYFLYLEKKKKKKKKKNLTVYKKWWILN